jgi:hypothetical protein
MNLTVGDGIAIAGCAASVVYFIRYTFGGWVRMRATAALVKAIIDGASSAIDKLKAM